MFTGPTAADKAVTQATLAGNKYTFQQVYNLEYNKQTNHAAV